MKCPLKVVRNVENTLEKCGGESCEWHTSLRDSTGCCLRVLTIELNRLNNEGIVAYREP